MIIELFGLPGSGKTTIAEKLSEKIGAEYIRVTEKRFGYILRFFLRHPLQTLWLISTTKKEGFPNMKLMKHKLFLLACAVARTQKARELGKNKTVILDEGFAQYGISLYEHTISQKKADAYMKRFADSDFVFAITADRALRRKRMDERGRIPRAGIVHNYAAWERILEENAEAFGTHMRIIENPDGALENIVASIAKEVS